MLEISARNGDGMAAWINWLLTARAARRPATAQHADD
jgi:hypothetical protein